MNARTARLLRKFARATGKHLPELKRVWNKTPRNKRAVARNFLEFEL